MDPRIVSPTIQEFDGARYYLCGKYFSRALSGGGREYLHRAVIVANGREILPGKHTHHKDGNTSNNRDENLEILSPRDHLSGRHGEAAAARLRGRVCWEAIDAARDWHASPKGRRWHSRHAQATHAAYEPEPRLCEQCGDLYMLRSFLQRTRQRFCSNRCKSAFRRESGVDDENRKCAGCEGVFRVNRYSTKSFCSGSCRSSAPGRSS